MAKLTVSKAKEQIIAEIRKHGGLFENCGQKQLRKMQDQASPLFWDSKCSELNSWIDSLDYNSVGYLLTKTF